MDKEQMELYAPAIIIVLLFAGLIALNLIVKGIRGKNAEADKKKAIIENDPYKNKTYDFDNPVNTILLDQKLKEISGLSFDGNKIFAVQDEEGLIFEIQNDGSYQSYEFHKDGDYEGIEKVDNDIFVVKNTGTLYKIENPGTEEQTKEKVNTFLDSSHDIEGLCFDKKNNSLLLTCKVCEEKDNRSIYRYDLKKKELLETPMLNISLEKIRDFIKIKGTDYPNDAEEKLKRFLFAPSAIAIHPQTDNIFISSSQGKNIVEFNREGEIISFTELDKKVHEQPEGLAFTPEGKLLISNEGKHSRAKIHIFEPKNN